MNKQRVSLMLSLVLACAVTNVWATEAGRVQFVNGEVSVSDSSGRMLRVQKGAAINEGDTVISAANASAQIRMLDGGFIAVRPDTRLKFDSFKFGNKGGEPESSFFSLLKGGFRAITGLIGHLNKQDYRITTPSATIGIRGTDHETVIVSPDSPLVLAGQAAPGTYNKVNNGETSITTDKGTVNVLPNQMGFAGGQDQMPKIQPINMDLFTVAPPPAPEAKMEGSGTDASGARESAVVDNTAVAATGDATAVAAAGSSTALPASIAPSPVLVTSNQVLSSSSMAGGVGLFYTDSAGNVLTTGGGGIVQPILTGSGGLAGFTVTFGGCLTNCMYTTGFQSGSLGTASLLDQGSNVMAGNLHWGRWFGAGATVTGLPTGATFLNSNLIYIGGDIPTMPISGVATYVPVGGTLPVDKAGNTGTFIGASVSVNFGTPSITVSNMQVAFGGTTYTMGNANGPAPFLANGIIPSVPLSGNCATACPGVLSGDYAGAFTGVNAAGLGLGYHIAISPAAGSTPTFEIMGAQAFIKQ